MNLPRLYFRHPEPFRSRHRLYPVFLPFAGCPFKCIYCSQEAQTGQQQTSLEQMAQKIHQDISTLFKKNLEPYSLGFFGGTFTALPAANQELFLETALKLKKAGAVSHVRCSTRPDCMDHRQIRLLKDYRTDMVELGIQSFDNLVLSLSKRGYDGKKALEASRRVKKSGLELGIQLMPGLPGSNTQSFAKDLQTTAWMQPAAVRIYPCLVLEGTVLARKWSREKYKPWPLNTTLAQVSNALLRMWLAGIPVIRTGLAPEGSLLPQIKAGPWHPALGAICRGRALGAYVAAMASRLGAGPLQVHVPQRYISDFWGHKKENEKLYQRSGIFRENVDTWDHELFMLAGHKAQLP